MRIFVIFCFIFVTLSANTFDDDYVKQQWFKFQEKYEKSYKSPVEKRRRFSIFEENLRKIEEHNTLFKNGKSTYMKGVNQFADWSSQEFLSFIERGWSIESKIWGKEFQKKKDFVLPQSIDWRNKSAVTDVKTQGMCGASWPFSAVGAIEGQLGLKGNLLSLSEQNLIDCVSDYGCSGGGSVYEAYEYVRQNGIESEVSYPFISAGGSCASDASKVVTKISNFVKIPANDEEGLQQALATAGPISVAIDVTENLQLYTEGILDDELCKNDTQNHAVLAVGFGEENDTEFYLIKNSWGKEWGQGGYFRLRRNKDNQCAIASIASYPEL